MATDAIQEGHFVGSVYHGANVFAVVDGAFVRYGSGDDMGVITSDELHKFILRQPSGEPPRLHWVDSPGMGVDREKWTYHSYGDDDQGQSASVDAKVQQLVEMGLEKTPGRLHLILGVGDGDHATSLWKGIEQRRKRGDKDVELTLVVWSAPKHADRARLSLKLRLPPAPLRAWKEGRFHIKDLTPEGDRLVFTPQSDEKPTLVCLLRSHIRGTYLRSGNKCVPAFLSSPNTHRLLHKGWVTERALEEFHLFHGLQRAKKRPRFLIVQGRTGSGKTTQVIQLMYDMMAYQRWLAACGLKFRYPRVCVTQPRRIACTSLAETVQRERDDRLMPWDSRSLQQPTVGYHIGGELRCTPETPLVYATSGVLLKQVVHSHVSAYDIICLDEFHERSFETDLLLAFVVQPEFHRKGIRVVVMSATIEGIVDKLTAYLHKKLEGTFGEWVVEHFDVTSSEIPINGDQEELQELQQIRDAIAIDDPEEPFKPPTPSYLEDINAPPLALRSPKGREHKDEGVMWQEREDFAKDFLRKLAVEPGRGNFGENGVQVVLVFLPSMMMIRDFAVYLGDLELKEDRKVETCILHSQVDQESQQRAIQPSRPQEGVYYTKFILSTNVAESSITIPDATVVVDMCLSKDYVEKSLVVEYNRATKSSCEQRRGRVGRCSTGWCFRMITKEEWQRMRVDPVPELQQKPLEAVVLHLLSYFEGRAVCDDEKDPLDLLGNVLDPPTDLTEGLAKAKRVLLEKHAVRCDDSGRLALTPLGRMIHEFPLAMAWTEFVLWCVAVDEDLGIHAVNVAVMGERENKIFRDPDSNTSSVLLKAKHALLACQGYWSDTIRDANLLYDFWSECTACEVRNREQVLKNKKLQAWCKIRCLDIRELCDIEDLVIKIRRVLRREGYLQAKFLESFNPGKALREEGRKMKASLRKSSLHNVLLMFFHAAAHTHNCLKATPRSARPHCAPGRLREVQAKVFKHKAVDAGKGGRIAMDALDCSYEPQLKITVLEEKQHEVRFQAQTSERGTIMHLNPAAYYLMSLEPHLQLIWKVESKHRPRMILDSTERRNYVRMHNVASEQASRNYFLEGYPFRVDIAPLSDERLVFASDIKGHETRDKRTNYIASGLTIFHSMPWVGQTIFTIFESQTEQELLNSLHMSNAMDRARTLWSWTRGTTARDKLFNRKRKPLHIELDADSNDYRADEGLGSGRRERLMSVIGLLGLLVVGEEWEAMLYDSTDLASLIRLVDQHLAPKFQTLVDPDRDRVSLTAYEHESD